MFSWRLSPTTLWVLFALGLLILMVLLILSTQMSAHLGLAFIHIPKEMYPGH